MFLDVGPSRISQTPRDELDAAMVRAHRVMAARAPEVAAMVADHPNSLLTPALRGVLGSERTPDHLPWARHIQPAESGTSFDLGSYEAEAGGHLYSINFLDGTVLLDGIPPSRLPASITSDPLFVRTFGAGVNFEVTQRGKV